MLLYNSNTGLEEAILLNVATNRAKAGEESFFRKDPYITVHGRNH